MRYLIIIAALLASSVANAQTFRPNRHAGSDSGTSDGSCVGGECILLDGSNTPTTGRLKIGDGDDIGIGFGDSGTEAVWSWNDSNTKLTLTYDGLPYIDIEPQAGTNPRMNFANGLQQTIYDYFGDSTVFFTACRVSIGNGSSILEARACDANESFNFFDGRDIWTEAQVLFNSDGQTQDFVVRFNQGIDAFETDADAFTWAIANGVLSGSTSDLTLSAPDGSIQITADLRPSPAGTLFLGTTTNNFAGVAANVYRSGSGASLQIIPGHPSGSIILGTTGQHTFPGVDSALTMGVSGVEWLRVYTDNLRSSASTDLVIDAPNSGFVVVDDTLSVDGQILVQMDSDTVSPSYSFGFDTDSGMSDFEFNGISILSFIKDSVLALGIANFGGNTSTFWNPFNEDTQAFVGSGAGGVQLFQFSAATNSVLFADDGDNTGGPLLFLDADAHSIQSDIDVGTATFSSGTVDIISWTASEISLNPNQNDVAIKLKSPPQLSSTQSATCTAGGVTVNPTASTVTIEAGAVACIVTIGEVGAVPNTFTTFLVRNTGVGLVTFPDVAGVHDGNALCKTPGLATGGLYTVYRDVNDGGIFRGESCSPN